MKLKRVYKPDPAAGEGRPPGPDPAEIRARRALGEIPRREAERALGLVLDHVAVLRAKARQNFSTKLVEQGVVEGWLTAGRGLIVLHGPPETAYRVRRGPGHYCRHCGDALEGEAAARAHVAAAHAGQASPDPAHPGGYERLNHFEGEKVED